MEPIKTYDYFLQRLREKYGEEDRVVCLLLLDPTNDDAVAKYIYRRYDYFHVRTGDTLDFFCPGFSSETKKKRFDVRAFVEFIRQVEELTDWRYYGGTNILLLQYRDGDLCFDSVYDLNFTRMMVDGYVVDYKSFLEGFIRGFKHGIESYLHIEHAKRQIKNIWGAVAEFLPDYVKRTAKCLGHAARTYDYFAAKNLEKADLTRCQ